MQNNNVFANRLREVKARVAVVFCCFLSILSPTCLPIPPPERGMCLFF